MMVVKKIKEVLEANGLEDLKEVKLKNGIEIRQLKKTLVSLENGDSYNKNYNYISLNETLSADAVNKIVVILNEELLDKELNAKLIVDHGYERLVRKSCGTYAIADEIQEKINIVFQKKGGNFLDNLFGIFGSDIKIVKSGDLGAVATFVDGKEVIRFFKSDSIEDISKKIERFAYTARKKYLLKQIVKKMPLAAYRYDIKGNELSFVSESENSEKSIWGTKFLINSDITGKKFQIVILQVEYVAVPEQYVGFWEEREKYQFGSFEETEEFIKNKHLFDIGILETVMN